MKPICPFQPEAPIAPQASFAQRLPGLDFLKISSAVWVFLFHCWMHLGVPFSFFTPFISQGAIFMDLFFIVSGFGMMWSNRKTVFDKTGCTQYFIKRLVGLYPLYLVTHIIFSLFLDGSSLLRKAFLLPIELTLTQSFIPGLFSYSHNGGTWFVSCLAFCYFSFPCCCVLIRWSSVQIRRILLVLCYFFSSLPPLIVAVYELPNLYSSPILRLLEFLGGMLLCSFYMDQRIQNRPVSAGKALSLAIFSFAALLVSVTLLVKHEIYLHSYVTYGFVTFPLFMGLLYGSLWGKPPTALWHKLSEFCYPAFMAQFYVWPLSRSLFPALRGTVLILVPATAIWIVFSLLHWLVWKKASEWIRKILERKSIWKNGG